MFVPHPSEMELTGSDERDGVTPVVGLEAGEPGVPVRLRHPGLQHILKALPTVGSHMLLYQDHSSYRSLSTDPSTPVEMTVEHPAGTIHQLVTESGPAARGRLRKSITLPRSRQASIGLRSRARKNAEFAGVEESGRFYPQEKPR
jgi:hypothetical protein